MLHSIHSLLIPTIKYYRTLLCMYVCMYVHSFRIITVNTYGFLYWNIFTLSIRQFHDTIQKGGYISVQIKVKYNCMLESNTTMYKKQI